MDLRLRKNFSRRLPVMGSNAALFDSDDDLIDLVSTLLIREDISIPGNPSNEGKELIVNQVIGHE